MKAAFKKGQKRVVCVEVKKPDIKKDDDVLVKILHAGICGSDINRIRTVNKKWDSKILGHEGVGLIEKIGNKVKFFKIGDKVAIIPLVPCFNCKFCDEGNYSSCNNYSFIGSRVNGLFSEYISLNEKNLIKLPETIDIEKYIFLEPLTVALHSIYKANLKLGQSVTILGAGTIGLLIFQILRNLGMYDLVIADISEYNLKIAKKLGVHHRVNVAKDKLEEYIKKNICKFGVDVTFESSGSNDAKNNSILVTKSKGNIVLIGTSPENVSFKGNIFELILRKELVLMGTWMSYSSPFPGLEWATAIKILDQNMIDTKSMISYRYKLTKVNEAFDIIFSSKEKRFIKVAIDM